MHKEYSDSDIHNACPRFTDRVYNSIHSQNNYGGKLELLKNYRVAEDSPYKHYRAITSKLINPTRASYKNLLQSLNEILSWESVKVTMENATKDILERMDFLRYAYSEILPRTLDNPNAFWAVFPFINSNGEKDSIIEIFNYEDVFSQDEKDSKDGINYDIKIEVKNRKTLENGTYYFSELGIRTSHEKYTFDFHENKLKTALYGQLGGDIDPIGLDGNEKYFVSPIQGAFDTATLLFLLTLDAKLLEKGVLNVVTILRAMVCKPCNGSKYVPSDDNAQKTCPDCNGTGVSTKGFNLGDILYLNSVSMGSPDGKEARLSEQANNMIVHSHMPLDPLKFAYEIIERLTKQLQVDLAQVVPKTFQESASSNEQQWINRHYLCDTIGTNFFRTLKTIIQTIQDCNQVNSPDVMFNLPTTFIDENEAVIRARITQMKKDGATNAELLHEYKRLANKIYKDTPNLLRSEDYRLDNDYLAVHDSEGKILAATTERDRAYSEQLPSILERLSNEKANPNFAELTDAEITALVAKEFVYVEPVELTDGSEFNVDAEIVE